MFKRKTLAGSVAFALTSSLSVAHAGIDEILEGRPYVGIQGGVNFALEGDVEPSALGQEIEFDSDFYGGAVFGYAFRQRSWGAVRIEAEGFYRRNEPDSDGVVGGPLASGEGEVEAYGAMFNVFYSPEYLNWPVYPYIGAGVGYAEVETSLALNAFTVNDDDSVLAYQGILGVRWPVTENVSLTLDGRYFSMENPEFTGSGGEPFEFEYDSITGVFGLQYRF